MTREQARALRKSTTALEQRAWSLLKLLRDEGIAVRRQHPIGKFVADFAIMRARVAIEIDGPLHETPGRKQRDGERDQAFATLGWRVLRFTTTQLNDDLAFLTAIRAAASPSPSPRGEGVGGWGDAPFDQLPAETVALDAGGDGGSPHPLPPPLAGRGSNGAIPSHLRRRTRAHRTLKPRRAT